MFTIPVGQIGAFLPPTLQGCRCWLRSDLGITLSSGKVATWANQIAGVTGNATQGDGAKQPSYTANALNGLPSVGFTGPASTGLQWALDLQGAQTVAVVAQMSSTPSAGSSYSLLSLKGSTGPVTSELYTVIAGGYQNVTFKSDLSTLAAAVGYNPTLDTNAHAYIYTYDGGTNTSAASYTALYDGAVQTVVASGNVGGRAGTDLGSIGAFVDAGNSISNGFSGGVFEVIVYNRALTSAEKTLLARYLHFRYAI